MNVKKMFLVIVAVFSMVAFFGVNAYAGGWYVCQVKQAGAATGTTSYIGLSHVSSTPEFTGRWFVAASDKQKEMLATALAAMNSMVLVRAHLSSTGSYSTINSMYMMGSVPASADDMETMDMDMEIMDMDMDMEIMPE
jgi:hypothetical protein